MLISQANRSQKPGLQDISFFPDLKHQQLPARHRAPFPADLILELIRRKEAHQDCEAQGCRFRVCPEFQ